MGQHYFIWSSAENLILLCSYYHLVPWGNKMVFARRNINYINNNRLKMKLKNMRNYLMTILLKLYVCKEHQNNPTVKFVSGGKSNTERLTWQAVGVGGSFVCMWLYSWLLFFLWGIGWEKKFLTKNTCTVDQNLLKNKSTFLGNLLKSVLCSDLNYPLTCGDSGSPPYY